MAVAQFGPGKGNALGPAFWSELPELFATLDADYEVRAIVLTGSGRNFSYGLDLPAMGGTLAPVLADGAMAGPRSEFHTEVQRMQHTITAVADCRTPTIASIHGWCIGGGVDLISAVDFRYASADAKFSIREVKLAILFELSLRRLSRSRPLVYVELVVAADQDVEYVLGCHLIHTAFAASRMTSRTKSGWDSMGTWLLSMS